MSTERVEAAVNLIAQLGFVWDLRLSKTVRERRRAAIRKVLTRLVAKEQAEVERWKEQAFRPLGDNHHNAALCPHCSPQLSRIRSSLTPTPAEGKPAPQECTDCPWKCPPEKREGCWFLEAAPAGSGKDPAV